MSRGKKRKDAPASTIKSGKLKTGTLKSAKSLRREPWMRIG